MSCNYYHGKCLFLNGKEDGCIACPIKMAYNKGVRDATPIESITTKGGMTLSLQKTDIEISNLARCIAMALKNITVEEFANKYWLLTITDSNSGKSVSYRRIENGEETENEQKNFS